MMKLFLRDDPTVAGRRAGRTCYLSVGVLVLLSIGIVGCEPAGTQEMAREFARVQRTLNDRVDELEEELDQVKSEAAEALDTYQITTNELVNEVRQYQRKLAETQAELKSVRTVEETWTVRKRPVEEAGEPLPDAPTLAEVDAEKGAESFDSIFDEVKEDEGEDDHGDGADEDVDEEASECPIRVSGIKFLGRKRLDGRRESKYWTKAMEVDLENTTGQLVVAQMWAHPPPNMGWYFDDFGPKQLRLKPGQVKQNVVIPFDPEYELFLLVGKRIYTFPLEEGGN